MFSPPDSITIIFSIYWSLILDWYSKESIAFDKLISSWFAFLSTYLGSNHLLNIVVDKKNEIENIVKRDNIV